MPRSTGALIVVFLAGLVPAAHAWEKVLTDRGPTGADVAAFPDGDVVVYGRDDSNPPAVVRLRATDGEDIWRHPVGFTVPVSSPEALVVDADGDVLAIGPPNLPGGAALVKLAGATGSQIWGADLHTPDVGPDFIANVTGIAVGATGDVFAIGSVGEAAGVPVILAKVSGTTGAVVWRYADPLPGTPTTLSVVEIDSHGDVIALGKRVVSFNPMTSMTVVVKVSGTTGAEMWRKEFPDFLGGVMLPGGPTPDQVPVPVFVAIAVTGSDDVAAAGFAPSGGPIIVSVRESTALLSGVDGSTIWQQAEDSFAVDESRQVAALPSGDVVVSEAKFAVAVLSRTDGLPRWRRELACSPYDRVEALDVDAAGNVIVAGQSGPCPPSNDGNLGTSIAKLDGTDGAVVWARRYAEHSQGGVGVSRFALTPSGDAVATTIRGINPLVTASGSDVVLEFDGTTGALDVCGDGYVDAGEGCDDGNSSSGDCCSATCQPDPDGAACEDGNACTANDTCQNARCVGGPPLPCAPCGTCDPRAGCRIDTPSVCRVPTASNAAVLRLEDAVRDGADDVFWFWGSGAATGRAEFGDPTRSTDYALCVYQGTVGGGVAPVLVRATAPAGCGGSGCWHRTGRGFTYRSAGKPDGLRHISLKSGAPGRAQITVEGRGRRLDVPSLPLSGPVTVVLRRLDTADPCWTATEDLVLTNRTHRFVARGSTPPVNP